MPTIPAGAKTPEDHKPSAAERLESALSDDELLADMPSLTPPTRLRLRQRNRIMKLALGMRDIIPDVDDGESVEIDTDSLDEDTLGRLLDTMASVDEFAESIAEDPAAYAEWAVGKSYETFSALLARYSSAVGE